MQNQQTPAKGISRSQLERADLVIIGNGIAGLTAAVEARHLAPDKRIVIITDQIHPTINTPALKQFAIAKLAREQLLAYPSGTERAERIHVVNAHVEGIHAQSKYLTLNENRSFGYETLLIATGSSPSGIPSSTPGHDFDGVMTLHRLQDYLDLRRRIPEVSEVVVVGGGVHAIETAMGFLYWGKRVHLLIRSTIMGKTLDETASEMVLNNLRRAGAIIHTGTEVAGIVGRVGAVVGVITNHQEMIPCQLVAGCIGTRPAMSLAKKCSVPMLNKNGILVDDKLRTSVRDIYAAGDVAALRNPQTNTFETRAQWYAAVSQGRLAGAMMVGSAEHTETTFGVQWHATHLGELSMLTVGEPLKRDEGTVTMTDTAQGNYRRLAIQDDRLVGYLSLGTAQPDSLAIKRIIDEKISISKIIKPLLKGKFDARRYLSEQHAYAAQGMLTGRASTLQIERSTTTRRLPEALPPVAHLEPFAEPQPATLPRESLTRQAEPLLYEEEISPFTGNLPTVSRAGLPANKEPIPQPFTGNLPPPQGRQQMAPGYSLRPQNNKMDLAQAINARQNPTGRERAPEGKQKLWAFSDEIPVEASENVLKRRR
ncbi:NAD(P)/FAD-dependent oxidoreductase [Tengunoibacter tsumagoiensis]|uniref:FAD/NAD(P)-binding domain-containing protein n=1 Tax=Tengunoibacter tsumagoiensis TaxID=2014871 RepID=A0A401ZUP8_9CHLR|nr:FAD/NAD(P)-binding oxidoreductase [Tengunoibacter tsumagoiensis]GCE10621.1 hypothetical protein KTT_04800 [Tengunoibacter tsumagoiensis]